jgi:hypothetical protein
VIGDLSSAVPWWGAIVIALIAALSGLIVVELQIMYQNKVRKGIAKHAAYEEFIAASQVLTFRSEFHGGQKSVASAFGETISEMQKALLVLFLGAFVERVASTKWKILSHFFEAIPTPQHVPASMDGTTLRLAFEDLIRASVKVRLYGSNQALGVADTLRVRSQKYFELLDSRNLTWTGLPAQSVLDDARRKVVASTADFVAIARDEFEVKSKRGPETRVKGIMQ